MKKTSSKFLALVLAFVIMTSSAMAGSNLFSASAAGESPKNLTLIDKHHVWKYHDKNQNLFGDIETDFRSKDFDDSTWSSGKSPLGYPANEVDTGIFGTVSSDGTLVANQKNPNAYITYYFRSTFNVNDIAGIKSLKATLAIDDGCVIYINGKEVNRSHMPSGNIGHNTNASYVGEAKTPESNFLLDLTAYRQYLVRGENTIAVDVHNRDSNSSDIYFGLKLDATYDAGDNANSADKTPRQVNVHVGDDASTQANFTYTTVGNDITKAVLMSEDGSFTKTYEGESSVSLANKYFHKLAISDLKPATTYHYTVGVAPNTYSGKFKTAPEKGSKDTIKFIYLADTQVSNETNAKALGATLAEVNKMNPDFVYLAGDVTDSSTNEMQWEQLFNNGGAFPNGGQDMFGNYLIAAIQGNHDNNTFNRHINAPAKEGNIVYSFDYGPITFVMLNLETAKSDATARANQKAYLTAAIKEAQKRGQWTAVGFHKSLYTGASHVDDGDVIEARKYWTPYFAELDVDMVLQGHDHVYSRGFVNNKGENANPEKIDGIVQNPSNAPLYMVGGHAGGLKWYSKVNYPVTDGDPLTPNYAFLDVNSTNDQSDSKKEQVIVELEVSNTQVAIKCYMFKYDTDQDKITTKKYLYDSMTMERNVVAADIEGTEQSVAEKDEVIEYTVSYKDLKNANAFDTVVEYDTEVLEFVVANVIQENAIKDVTDKDGKVRVISALTTGALSGNHDVVTFSFKAKKPVRVDSTSVKLVKADTVKGSTAVGGEYIVTDVSATIDVETAETDFYSYAKASDINGDGIVSLADLSFAISKYQSVNPADKKYDIDLSGKVDVEDFVIIMSYIKTAA